MITNFRLFESFDKVIQDSYDDYMSLQSDEERKISEIIAKRKV